MSTTRLPRTSVSTTSSASNVPTQASRVRVEHSDSSWQPSPSGHLTVRGRRLISLIVALPIVGMSVFLGGQVAHALGAGKATTQIVVHQGESLWDVANRVAPQSDPREVIWTIQQLNHMKTSAILDGQSLTVPNFGK